MFAAIKKIREHKAVRRVNKVVLYYLIPVLQGVLLLFIFLKPVSFTVEGGFSVTPIHPEKNICAIHYSGYEVLKPGIIAFNGKYPWMYGKYVQADHTDDGETEFFVLNIKSGELQMFSIKQTDDFVLFLNKNDLPHDKFYLYSDLFPKDGDKNKIQQRKALRNRLSRPVL